MLSYFRDSDPLEMRQLGQSTEKLTKSLDSKQTDPNLPERFRREDFNSMAQQGLTFLASSENNDELPQHQTTAGVIFELAKSQLGRAIYLSVHLMVSKLIEKHGSSAYSKSVVEALLNGKKLGAFCLTEAGAGSDAAALSCSAKKNPDSYELNGEKIYITSGPEADIFLVFARTSEQGSKGISAFIVESDNTGLTVGKSEAKMGCEGSPISTVTFEKCKVSPDALIGGENSGFGIALSGLAGGRVNIAAAACGISTKAISIAQNFCKERKQFSKPIIEFQALRFMLADMVARTEASILLTRNAANELASGKRASAAAAIAKCQATDAAMQTTSDAVQLLGGAGYLREYRVEKLMRDAKMLQIVEGTNQIQRIVISNALLAGKLYE